MTDDAVWSVLNRNVFFVKDAVGRHEVKTSDKFDIYDPETQQLVLECREPDIGSVTKVARFIGGDHDAMAPFNLVATLPGTQTQVLRIARAASLVNFGGAKVELFNAQNTSICCMKKKFAFGLQYKFFTDPKNPLFVVNVKGLFLGGSRLLIDKKQVALITPKWKESHADYFKQGFKYAVTISEDVPKNNVARQVLLAFAISIDRLIH